MIDDLKEIAKHEIRRKERDEDEMRENADEAASDGSSASEEKNVRFADTAASRAEDNRIQSQYGGAFQAINSCQWLDIDRIGSRLLGKEKLSDIEWLYLKMLLTEPKYESICRNLKFDQNSVVLLFSTEGDTDPENYRRIIA